MWKRDVTRRNFVSAPDGCKAWAWFSQSRFYSLFQVNLHLFKTFLVQKSIMLVEAFNWRSGFKTTMSISFQGSCNQLCKKTLSSQKFLSNLS